MIFNIIIGMVLWFMRPEMSDTAFNILWWLNIITAIMWAVGIIVQQIKYYRDCL